jgi:hypothetical protein
MRRLLLLGFIALPAALGLAACDGSSPIASPMAPTTDAPPAPTPPATPPPPATTRYSVTFEATWNRNDHPTDFPGNPHFSPLIGGTHNDTVRFWNVGVLATEGIRRMSEEGLTSPLDMEIMTAIGQGSAQHLLRGSGIGRSPGSTSIEFDISRDYPLVTLVSMIAPSPDWFTGVSGLPLFRDGNWVAELRVELFPHDAGTDGGTTYDAPNDPLRVNVPVAPITGRPFVNNGAVAPVGVFTFRRLQ